MRIGARAAAVLALALARATAAADIRCSGASYSEIKSRCCGDRDGAVPGRRSIVEVNSPASNCRDECTRRSWCTAANYDYDEVQKEKCRLYSQETSGWRGIELGLLNLNCRGDSCFLRRSCGTSRPARCAARVVLFAPRPRSPPRSNPDPHYFPTV